MQLEKEVAAGAKRAVALEADLARSPHPHISTPTSGLRARCVGVVFGVEGFEGSGAALEKMWLRECAVSMINTQLVHLFDQFVPDAVSQ